MFATNTPINLRLYAMMLLVFILNLTCDPNLSNSNLLSMATGQVGDLSTCIHFFSMNQYGQWYEFLENCSHTMIFHIQSNTDKLLHRSKI